MRTEAPVLRNQNDGLEHNVLKDPVTTVSIMHCRVGDVKPLNTNLPDFPTSYDIDIVA